MAKLPMNILNFARNDEEIIKGYENFREYFSAYKNNKTSNEAGVSFADMDKTMLNFFKDEVSRLSGKDINQYSDVAQYVQFSDVVTAAFSVVGALTDLILPDALIKDTGMIADVKSGAWGDTMKIDIKPRDLFVVSKGQRGKRTFDITRQYKGTKTIMPEPRHITVGISLYEILIGKYSLAEFASKAVQSLEVNMKYEIFDAFEAAMASLSNVAGDGQLRITGFSEDTAIGLAQKVQAWNGGAKAIFLGTKLAISRILPTSTNSRILLGDEYVKIGYLRDFFGFSVVELEQVADYKTEFAVKLDDKKVYILCPGTDKIVKVFLEGSTLSHAADNYANANLINEATFIKSYGVGVITSAIAGVIELA